MRQDTGTGSDELRILQLGWMLFLKIFSDKDKKYQSWQELGIKFGQQRLTIHHPSSPHHFPPTHSNVILLEWVKYNYFE
jgi:hypothetical protein